MNENIIFNNEYNCAEFVAKDRCNCVETVGDTVVETACCDACKDVGVYTVCCCYLTQYKNAHVVLLNLTMQYACSCIHLSEDINGQSSIIEGPTIHT